MDSVPIKPERKTERLNFALEPSLKAKITKQAETWKVSEAQAARYILATFFDTENEKSVVENENFIVG